jgi:ribosome-associated protein
MLMQLGKTLVELNERQLNALELPEDALRVIGDTRRIQAPAAKNRAMRLVRAALRDLDAKQIQRRLRDLQDPPPAAARAASGEPSPLVTWRDRLVSGGDEALDAFMTEFPAADRQRLRQLARNARKAPESARKQSLDALANVLRQHVR